MERYFKKIITASAALICALAVTCEANAAVSFRGRTAAENVGESVTVALYAADADINNIKASDIRYINQAIIASDGTFTISLPVSYTEVTDSILVSNIRQGNIYSSEIPIYASADGTEDGDGTAALPFTFQKALENVEDGGKIIVDGTIVLPVDFVWPISDKTITVSGINNAVLDIKTVDNLNIFCNTTFENLTFGCASSGTGKNITNENAIIANGYHVIIRESVNTETVLAVTGGSLTQDVASTNLEIYGGQYKRIYGGGSSHNVNGDCRVTVGGSVNADFSVRDDESNYVSTVLHGGGWGCIVKGDCVTTIKDDAKFAYVYGGSNGQATSHVEGKIVVNISGGSCMNVFGACYITEGKSVDSEINMSGGTVEGLFASDKAFSGNVTMNITGGTIIRRIYGGCYNDWSFGFKSDNYVKGNSTVVLGPKVKFNKLISDNSGIFGGSRTDSNHTDEYSKLIFIDGAYDKLGSYVGEQGGITVNNSHHDYLIKASPGGTVSSAGADIVSIVPNIGYSAAVNGSAFAGSEYTLLKKDNTVVFEKSEGISSVEYTEDDNSVRVAYDISSKEQPGKIITAVYGSDSVLLSVTVKPLESMNGQIDIDIGCRLESGKSYTIKAMIWNADNRFIPLCPNMSIVVPTVE